MNVKLSEILNAREILGKLSDEKLPVKAAYSVAKLVKRVNEELNTFNDMRQALLKKYEGEEQTAELQSKLREEFEEVLETEVSIEISKIDLTNTDIELTAKEVLVIEPFANLE